MKPYLDGCRAKIKRAREHVGTIKPKFDTFSKDNPNRIFVDHDAKSGLRTVWIQVVPPPLEIAAISGDVVHNLRSALDHLVWQLVIAHGNVPGKWNSFPVYTSQSGFEHDIVLRDEVKRGRGPLRGIDAQSEAWTMIDTLQPYKTPNIPSEIAAVHTFWQVDKHRILHTYGMFLNDPTDIWRVIKWNPNATILEQRVAPSQPLEGRAEIAWVRFAPDGPDPKMRMEGNLPAIPTIGDGDRFLSIALWPDLVEAISQVIESFDREF